MASVSLAVEQVFKGLEEWENKEMKLLELDYKIKVLNCLPKECEFWAVENHQILGNTAETFPVSFIGVSLSVVTGTVPRTY